MLKGDARVTIVDQDGRNFAMTTTAAALVEVEPDAMRELIGIPRWTSGNTTYRARAG